MKNQDRNPSVLLVVVLGIISFSTIWGLSEGRLVRAAPPAQIITTLLSEGFEDSFPPSGWFAEAVAGTSGMWARSTDTVHPFGGGTHSGGYLAYFNSYTATAGDAARLYTPNLDFGAAGNYYLSFWMYHDLGYSNRNDYLQIEVNNGSGWTEVGNAIYRYDGAQGWAQHTIDLSAYAGQVISVSLKGVSAWGNDIHIDDVLIYSQTSPNPASAYSYLPLVLNGAPQITPTNTPTYTPTNIPTLTSTPTPTPTNSAPFTPDNGHWLFTSGGAIPIQLNISGFNVSSGSMTVMSIWVNQYPCDYLFSTNQPVAIINNSFSFSLYSGNWIVSGSFTSPTTATGHMHVAYSPFNPACQYSYLSYDDYWQATGP